MVTGKNDEKLPEVNPIVDLDRKPLPSGNAKGSFGYFRLRAPTSGAALGKSNLYPRTDSMQFLQEQKTAEGKQSTAKLFRYEVIKDLSYYRNQS